MLMAHSGKAVIYERGFVGATNIPPVVTGLIRPKPFGFVCPTPTTNDHLPSVQLYHNNLSTFKTRTKVGFSFWSFDFSLCLWYNSAVIVAAPFRQVGDISFGVQQPGVSNESLTDCRDDPPGRLYQSAQSCCCMH